MKSDAVQPISQTEPQTHVSRDSDTPGFLSRTRLYYFELVVAMIALMLSGWFMTATAALLVWKIGTTPRVPHDTILMLFAIGIIIWAPVAVILYARTRAHELRTSQDLIQPARRTLGIVYQVLTLLSAGLAALGGMQTLIWSLTAQNDQSHATVLMSGALSLVAVIWLCFLSFAYTKKAYIPRKLFLVVITVLACGLFSIATVVYIRQSFVYEQALHSDHCKLYPSEFTGEYLYCK